MAIDQLREYAKSAPNNFSDTGSSFKDAEMTEQHRKEMAGARQLQKENEQLRDEILDKDTILKRESAQNERLQLQLGEGERRLQQLHSELNELREEITSERKQWSEQLAESELPFQKLRQLNKKFSYVLEQLRELELQNEHLSEECQTLKQELNAATVQIRIATGQLQHQQRAAQRAHNLNEQLLHEKEHLEQECEIYRQLVHKFEQQEQTVVAQSPQQLIGKQGPVDFKVSTNYSFAEQQI